MVSDTIFGRCTRKRCLTPDVLCPARVHATWRRKEARSIGEIGILGSKPGELSPVGEILPEFGTEGDTAAMTIRRLLSRSAESSAR